VGWTEGRLPIRLGLIGLGRIGSFHAQTLTDLPAVDSLVVADAGREVAEVYATGGNRGDELFARAGDVDTSTAVLTLDDGTLALVSNSRYNPRGHDVRMELHGSRDSIAVGLDDRLGAGTHPATPAGRGQRRAAHPRRRPARHHLAVRCAGGGHQAGDRRLPSSTPPRRVPGGARRCRPHRLC
jgi:predicted dehydrogenase